MSKRIGSLLLSLALCLSLLPTAALAEETQPEEPLPGEQLEQVQPVPEEPEENEEQPQQDKDIIAVQELIDALPEASALDEMDAEAQESACLAASEAYEAYDALTEDQQSAITGTDNLLAILAWATQQVALLADGDTHTHKACLDTSCNKHTSETWTGVADLSSITERGYYYLANDVTLTSTWTPANGVVLCLNGHSITSKSNSSSIKVDTGVTFTLTDCNGSNNGKGKVTHDTSTGRGVYVNGGTFTMYGGSITGNEAPNSSGGGGVFVDGGTFNMSGNSSITNNTANYTYGGGGVYVAKGTFQMTGGSITGNNASTYGGGVFVFNTGKFNLYNGTISSNNAQNGGGVFLAGGKCNMSGGSISNNAANDGGAIYVSSSDKGSKGDFNMSAGSVTDNKADRYGGGTFIVTSCNFTISGGTITQNTAADGGGVFANADSARGTATFTVSGTANIIGNKKKDSDAASNVYLEEDGYTATITIGTSGLKTGASIGVTTKTEPTSGAPKQIATGADNAEPDYAAIFTPDVNDKGYVITKDESGNLYLSTHQHSWTYALKEGTTDTITATCKDCPQNSGNDYSGGSMGISEISTKTYSGKAQTFGDGIGFFTADLRAPQPKRVYQVWSNGAWKNLAEGEAPTNAGTYKALLVATNPDKSEVIVSKEFTIAKANPQAGDFSVTLPADLTYNGSAKEATAALNSPKTGAGDITVKYFDKDGNSVEVANVKNAGTYTVKISAAGGDNYNTASDLMAESWKFTIKPGTQTITVPTDKTIIHNGKAVNISGWATIAGVSGGTAPGTLSYALDGTVPAGVTLENGQLTAAADVAAGTEITIKVTAAETTNYNAADRTFTVTVVDKATANVSIQMSSATLTYGDTFTLTPTAKDGETALSGGTWTWNYDTDYFKLVESNANDGTLKLQVIKAGTPTKAITMTYTSDTYTGSNSVAVSSIAKKTLTQADLNGIPDKLTKVYDGGTGYTYPNGTAIALTLKDSVQVLDSDRNMQIGISANQITFAQSDAGETTAKIDLTNSALTPNYKFADGFTEISGIPAEITQRPLTVESATAENRVFKFEIKAVDVLDVTFDGLPDGVTELTKDTDYTVTGTMFDDGAGQNKNVTITVTLKNGNYSLTKDTTTTTVNISKATYTGGSVAVSWRYNEIGTKTVSLNESLPHGVGSAHYSIQNIQNENGVLTGSPTLAYGEYNSTVTYTLAGQNQYAADHAAQFKVEVDSPNYEKFTILCDITLLDKGDATVSINDMPNTVTYGDTFTLTAAAKDVDEGTLLTDGAWTWTSSDASVLAIEGSGSSVTVKALKAGTASITVSYESETMKGMTTTSVMVGKKSITAPAADQTVYTYNGTEQTYQLAEDGAYSITGNKQTNANETGYAITVSLNDKVNTKWAGEGDDTADKPYTFIIKKAAVTITAKDQSTYVGATAPVLGADSYTVSGLFGADKLTTEPTLKYVDANSTEITPDMTKTGDTIIRASGASAGDNYTISYDDGKLTVSSRPSSGGGSSSPSYTVTVPGKTANGSVTVSPKSARKGDTVTVTATPDKGYTLETITVLDKDGKELKLTEKNGKYTFTMPAGKVEVKASFMEDNTMLNYFVDVKSSDYFYDAVLWAAQNGITAGTDAVHFSPSASCTRAQIVTFLWRAAGSPEPKNASSFTDVSSDAYYAKAVAWAVENGITGGTGDGKFSPNAACTRAQAVTFLYRVSGSPAVRGGSAFSDVAASAYYADAVAWAEQNGVTGGIGNGKFGTGSDCTRAQIVTFLYRAYQGK